MNEWLKADLNKLWHPYSPLSENQTNLLIERGKGCYLITDDGRRLFDGISSWWVNLHGHSHPALAEALAKQAAELEHVIFAGFTHKPAITLAKNLLSILPSNQSRIFYSDNGSTAVEVALKMAMQYWENTGVKKPGVIALEGAYHGDTFGAMSVGARGLFTRPFSDYLFDVFSLPFPSDENVVTVFESRVRMGDVGIFIYEPLVQGASGMRMYSSDVLGKLLSVAKEHHVLCIADEVFTGFCRTGKYFASDYLSIAPDLICLSKGLTGGTLPLGVTSCSREVEAAFLGRTGNDIFFHGHSFTANPLACAVANASFQLLVDLVCQSAIGRISERHADFARRLHGHPLLRDVRFTGTILALEIHHGMTEYTNELRNRIYTFFLDRNILLRPLGNIVYVLPPYCTTDAELEMIYSAIEDFLESFQ